MYAHLTCEEKRIGLNALLRKYNVPINPLKDSVSRQMDLVQDYWKRRPLTGLFYLFLPSLLTYLNRRTASLCCWRCIFSIRSI